jgi:hypothetical protein
VSKKPSKIKVPKNSPLGINQSKLNLKPGISFSFKYFDGCLDDYPCYERYWQTFTDRLKALSGMTVLELTTNRSKALRCHPINWETTSRNGFGIPNEDQIVDTPYQFSLSSNEHGRIHGFFIDNLFYVVWLDPTHQLYPGNPMGN